MTVTAACLGRPIPRELREQLEATFAEDLSFVRIHTGPAAAAVAAQYSAIAITKGPNIYFADGFGSQSSTLFPWIMAHETAHCLQQRSGIRSRAPLTTPQLEEEARQASVAAARGERFRVLPVRNCPDAQPLAFLVLIGIALAISATATVVAFSRPEDLEKDRLDPNLHLYERGLWMYCPIVGSYSMMTDGRSEWDRYWGTAFFILDLTLVGGVVRGVVGRLGSTASQQAARLVAGAGTAAEREAWLKLQEAGAKFVTQAEANQVLQAGMKSTNRYVMIAVSEGYLNHSAVYVYDTVTQISYKLHGSVLTLIEQSGKRIGQEGIEQFGKRISNEEFAQRIAAKANRLSVFTLEESAGERGLEWWGKLTQQGRLGQFMEAGFPRGCASTQGMLLEKFAIPGADGLSRLLEYPLTMDLGRATLNAGNHLVIQGGRQTLRELTGTAIQSSVAYAIPGEGGRHLSYYFAPDQPGKEAGFAATLDAQARSILVVPHRGLPPLHGATAPLIDPGGLHFDLQPQPMPAPPPKTEQQKADEMRQADEYSRKMFRGRGGHP